MKSNPYESPHATSTRPVDPSADRNKLLDIAKAQRAMMWLLMAKLALDFGSGLPREWSNQPAVLGFWFAYVLVGIAVAFFVFRLANGVYGIGPAILCSVLTFLPCLGTLTILVLNGNTMDRLRKRGVRVGFMGSTTTQLQELSTASVQQRRSGE